MNEQPPEIPAHWFEKTSLTASFQESALEVQFVEQSATTSHPGPEGNVSQVASQNSSTPPKTGG